MRVRNGHHTPERVDFYKRGRRDYLQTGEYMPPPTGQALWDYAAGWNDAAEECNP